MKQLPLNQSKINIKQQILNEIVSQLQQDIEISKSSLSAAVSAATDAESKPENKYDTRALEASYLAGAQQSRLLELTASLEELKAFKLDSVVVSKAITLGSIVELDASGIRTFCFLASTGAGKSVEVEATKYQVVTPLSPLGRGLVSKSAGDWVNLLIAGKEVEYEIIDVF
jgi:transcription elongation GreA/GreB family factor